MTNIFKFPTFNTPELPEELRWPEAPSIAYEEQIPGIRYAVSLLDQVAGVGYNIEEAPRRNTHITPVNLQPIIEKQRISEEALNIAAESNILDEANLSGPRQHNYIDYMASEPATGSIDIDSVRANIKEITREGDSHEFGLTA